MTQDCLYSTLWVTQCSESLTSSGAQAVAVYLFMQLLVLNLRTRCFDHSVCIAHLKASADLQHASTVI